MKRKNEVLHNNVYHYKSQILSQLNGTFEELSTISNEVKKVKCNLNIIKVITIIIKYYLIS